MNAIMLLAVLIGTAELPSSSQDGVALVESTPFVTPDNADRAATGDPNSTSSVSKEDPVRQSDAEEPAPKKKQFGALLDVGAPDGIGISAVYSPWYFVRVHAGVMSVIYLTGFRLGVTLIPFNYSINPTLSADYGHFFQSNMTSLLPSGADNFAKSVASAISADYINLHLGLEFGRPQKFQFYIRGGISFASTSPENFSQAFSRAANNPNIQAANPTVHVTIPSIKIGAVLFFL